MKILKNTLASLLIISLASCKKEGKTIETSADSLITKKDSVVVPEIYKDIMVFTQESLPEKE